jgi:uncharacterized membrane protein
MSKLRWLLTVLLLSTNLFAHEGHHHVLAENPSPLFFGFESFESFIHWIGTFHLAIIHFPIALTIMTVVAEILFIWYRRVLFEQAAYFMIVAAAVWAPPTALLGFAYSYHQVYTGIYQDLFVWHRYFGSVSALLAVVTAYLRYAYVNQKSQSLTTYYCCLFFLFICVSLTCLFGGSLTFGI